MVQTWTWKLHMLLLQTYWGWCIPNMDTEKNKYSSNGLSAAWKKVFREVLAMLKYTPGSTNIAGWEMDQDWRCISYQKKLAFAIVYRRVSTSKWPMKHGLNAFVLGLQSKWGRIDGTYWSVPSWLAGVSKMKTGAVSGVGGQFRFIFFWFAVCVYSIPIFHGILLFVVLDFY